MTNKLLLIAFISFILSCNQHQNTIENSNDDICRKLYLRNTTDTAFSEKDFTLILKTKGSIYVCWYYHNNNGKGSFSSPNKEFYILNDAFYERKLFYGDSLNILESSFLLSFSHKDTSYSIRHKYYESDKFAIKGSEDWKYIIKKINNNNFLLQKTSLVDSTYTEKYYYDSLFQINKIVENKFGKLYEYY